MKVIWSLSVKVPGWIRKQKGYEPYGIINARREIREALKTLEKYGEVETLEFDSSFYDGKGRWSWNEKIGWHSIP